MMQTAVMDELVNQVRCRVLELVSLQPHDFHDQDLDQRIRQEDVLIRMFITNHQEEGNGEADVEAISLKLIATMKWRKSFGVPNITAENFPLELWQRNHILIHEGPDYLIAVRTMRKHTRISDAWANVMIRYGQYFHEKVVLPAKKAGKQVIVISDASGTTVTGMDKYFQEKSTQILTAHFPCMSDKSGIYGLPWIFTSMISVFIKFSMSASMKKRFTFYDNKSIAAELGPDRLPQQFGGTVEFKPIINIDKHQLKSVKDQYQEWGLQKWESEKILQSYSS